MSGVTAQPAATPLASILGQLRTDTVYLLVGLPLALASFVLLVTGLSLGAGLLITLLGFPVLVLTLHVAQVLAAIERVQLPGVLGHPVAARPYRPIRTDAGVVARVLDPLTDPQRWLDAAHGLVRFPVAVLTWSVTVAWWALTLTALSYPLWSWLVPRDDQQGLAELLGLTGRAWDVGLTFGIGVVAAATLPWLMRGLAVAQAGLGRELLTAEGSVTLRQRVDDLGSSRDAAASAEAAMRSRVARDLHDGPQQRLVRIAMDLTAAERAMEADPAGARTLVADALAETRDTLDELRTVARGVAPAILTDRGLEPALTAVAARSAVPVSLAVDLAERPPPRVEQAAYFTISECLTNVVKHAHATHAEVTVRRDGPNLRLEVGDDGRGGAHLTEGHGLAGLADRLAGVEGTLHIDSPIGGPTRVTASIPCG